MKARHEFKTDDQYSEYLRVYFAGIIIAALIDHEYGNEEYFIPKAVSLSEELIQKLKKKY